MLQRIAAEICEEDFDQGGYLAANPDVAGAVADGSFSSGWAHFDHGLRSWSRSIGLRGRRFALPRRQVESAD